jgi:uncharacterized protein (UPF0333 family)
MMDIAIVQYQYAARAWIWVSQWYLSRKVSIYMTVCKKQWNVQPVPVEIAEIIQQ